MIENKSTALNGTSNKRLNNVDLRNNEMTFPLVDAAKKNVHSAVTFPPEEDVIHAKEWVDDGSLL